MSKGYDYEADAKAAVAQGLRALREKRHYGKAEVARALETSASQIDRWETGKQSPGLSNFVALAAIYEVSAESLIAPVHASVTKAKTVLKTPKKRSK